mmetsp:Transcript_12524/g.24975  ORF Transcript_12524/g.24975 Transcript_12524/m.24975 type:complete len:81 (+) Transcript_12524:448-690(+)
MCTGQEKEEGEEGRKSRRHAECGVNKGQKKEEIVDISAAPSITYSNHLEHQPTSISSLDSPATVTNALPLSPPMTASDCA